MGPPAPCSADTELSWFIHSLVTAMPESWPQPPYYALRAKFAAEYGLGGAAERRAGGISAPRGNGVNPLTYRSKPPAATRPAPPAGTHECAKMSSAAKPPRSSLARAGRNAKQAAATSLRPSRTSIASSLSFSACRWRTSEAA